MRIVAVASAVWAVGCAQDYEIGQDLPNYGPGAAPVLESPEQLDRIVQVTTPLVDVLWIVDNSGSMSDNQALLAQNFPGFIQYFLGSGLDYHIGVVSTDMDAPNQSGKLIAADDGSKWIDLDSADPEGMFAQMAMIGATGSGDERGREAAWTALELLKDTDNAGFLRTEAVSGVHAVVVSDEDDYSAANVITKDEFADYMNALRPDPLLVTWNSICQPPDVLIDGGDNYVYLTNAIGGLLKDIRNDDWQPVLEDLGIQAAGLKREFFLSKLPVVDTLVVQVEDPEGTVFPFAEDDWTYSSSRNSVTFVEFLPDPLSSVLIRYTVSASIVDGAPLPE